MLLKVLHACFSRLQDFFTEDIKIFMQLFYRIILIVVLAAMCNSEVYGQ